MVITARSNEKVKYLRRLIADKKAREEEGVYVAEGSIILSELSERDRVLAFFVRQTEEAKTEKIVSRFPGAEKHLLSSDVFDSVSDTVTPSGIIAVVKKRVDLDEPGDTVIVLDGVSDAGNVGTIIRTASACGIEDAVILHSCADPFSPKAVRASMGGIFKTNVRILTIEEAKDFLKDFCVVVLDMKGQSIFDYERKEKTAIVVGNEAHGVSTEVRTMAQDVVSLPMAKDGVESLNASVAAGIAMYLIKKGE